MEREEYMRHAMALAQRAQNTGDVPVGCVVVHNGEIVGEGWNRREDLGDALAHAECQAIQAACGNLGGWNLHNCDLYVTLEPCPMCAGAIINSRIARVFYGARDDKGGACGGVVDLFWENFNHKPQVYGGILEEECRGQLQGFFHSLRKNVDNS